jgi:hypothetical protein
MNETLPLSDLLKEKGHAGRRAAERTLVGASFAMTGGNMGEIRILEGGTVRRDAIAEWLQEQDFLGLLFSAARNEVEGVVPGSLSLSLVDLDHDRAPDLVYVLRSDETNDAYGNPGLGRMTQGDVPLGGGMHGGLNRYELNTVMLARGARFPAGMRDDRPAGIIDIAPTTLAALGLSPAATMTGQSLAQPIEAPVDPLRFETGSRNFRQALTRADRAQSRIILGGRRD